MKPIHTFIILASILFILGVVALLFPNAGIKFNSKITFRFYNLQPSNKKNELKDIAHIIAHADAKAIAIDSSSQLKSLSDGEASDTIQKGLQIKTLQTLEFDTQKPHPLAYFYAGLKASKEQASSIRILHYGDSQIEADRISEYLRTQLQNEFGGSGIGLLPLVQISQTVGIKQYNSALWNKVNGFLGLNRQIGHKNYGPLISFSNFVSDGDSTEEWIKLSINRNAGNNISNFSKLKLFYGNGSEPCTVKYFEDDELKDSDSLKMRTLFNIKQWRILSSAKILELRFLSQRSPDIYGLALDSDYGVQLDNIPLRGSSGTFFSQINLQHLKSFYDYLNVKLIILQFGGNALPAIDSELKAKNYGDYYKSQILAIKRKFPELSILVVGPADMSVKEGLTYVSHPQLEYLRNSIRSAAKSTNCAFWDMYEAMGGNNSMPAWVNASPSLAAKDYIHFSPIGARKIAVLLYDAIMKDYNNKPKTLK